MAEYQLTATDTIIRTEDGACIPPDPANRDYAEYLQWVEDGGVPDPYVPPDPVPVTLNADQRLDAGVSAAISTAQAALTAIEDIPTTGAIATRFAALQLQTGILAAAFVAMLEAHNDVTPEE